MTNISRLIIALVFLILVSAKFALAEDKETRIARKDLPAPVLAAFQRDYPQAKLVEATRETENDSVFYEIESKQAGVKRDLLYRPNGALVSVEEKMKPGDLPAFVRDSLKKEHPKGKIKSAEKITRGGVTSFEVVMKDGKRLLEIGLAPDGTVTKSEDVTGKDDD